MNGINRKNLMFQSIIYQEFGGKNYHLPFEEINTPHYVLSVYALERDYDGYSYAYGFQITICDARERTLFTEKFFRQPLSEILPPILKGFTTDCLDLWGCY